MSRFDVNELIVNIATLDVSTEPYSDVSQLSKETEDVSRELDQKGLGPAAIAALGSVGLALYYYYVRGDKERGQFIGLWPPTILGMASYLKASEIAQQLQSDEN